MGLDVYVGQLIPYFNGDWEAEGAQAYIDDGGTRKAVVIKSNRRTWRSAGINSVPEALETVQNWRKALSEGLGLPEILEWEEDCKADYYTLELGWPGHGGLLLWAAYEVSGTPPPLHVPDDAYSDPVLQGARAAIKGSRYKSLLDNTEIWLPGPHEMTFRAPDPTGKKVDLSFTGALLSELEDLNERTWRADMDTITKWSVNPVEEGDPLEACAQFGFSVLYRLGLTSWQHKLPLVLDY